MNTARQAIVFGFGVAVLLAAAYVVRHALMLIYISCIFAVVLSPAISWLSHCALGSWHPSRGSPLAIFGFLAVVSIISISIFPFLAISSQVRQLTAQ